MEILYFESSRGFRRWLQAGQRLVREIWVGFYKRTSGQPSITYAEAVEEALCFGWIDGVRRSVNKDAYTVRFTPRKARSQWSAVNLRRAEQLISSGRMRPAGLKAFAGAKDQRRTYSYEQRRQAALDSASERHFRRNRQAWAFLQAQPPWYRRTTIFWVISAKREDTRKKRLETLIADSERGRLVKPLRRPPIPKRSQERQ